MACSLTDISKMNQMSSTSQKKRLLAKAQQQAHFQNQKQIPQIRVDNYSYATKQELSSEDEDSLTSRLNYLNAQNYHNNVMSNRRYYEPQSGQYVRNTKLDNLEGEKLIKCAVSPNRRVNVNGRSGHTGHHHLPAPHLSPVQPITQSLYLGGSSNADLYREYCHPTVYVTSNLSQPYIAQQQKYVIAPNAAQNSGPFCQTVASLPAPPPAHDQRYSTRSTVATAVGYAPTSSHPLPAHIQQTPSAVTAMPLQFAGQAMPHYSYNMSSIASTKAPYQHLYQIFGD